MNASARRPPATPVVLLTLLDHLLLPLGQQLSTNQLAPFVCGDLPMLYKLDLFPIEPHLLHSCAYAHASLAYAMQL